MRRPSFLAGKQILRRSHDIIRCKAVFFQQLGITGRLRESIPNAYAPHEGWAMLTQNLGHSRSQAAIDVVILGGHYQAGLVRNFFCY